MEGVQQQLGEAREQVAGAIDFMLDDLRQKWKELSGGPSVTEGLRGFVAAVDWSVRAIRRGWVAWQCCIGSAGARTQLPVLACRLPPLRCRRRRHSPAHHLPVQERWIQGLLAFHLTLLVVVVALRRVPYLHYFVFLGISESLGRWSGCCGDSPSLAQCLPCVCVVQLLVRHPCLL